MTVPTGNGEARGPESADGMGNPLPGSRPDRARKNEAANPIVWKTTPLEPQGFGQEDMHTSISYMGSPDTRPADLFGPPPHLMALGDPGETFGGA